MTSPSLDRRRFLGLSALVGSAGLLTACAGENAAAGGAGDSLTELNIDFATYNPLSLVIKEKGWLEATLAEREITVNWLQSAGSNKANTALRSNAIHVGSTAGSAALLSRANGTPIKTIGIYSQPEWSALVVGPDSDITSAEQLAGTQVAATKGTDPYFFLLQTLHEHGLSADDITLQNLQHADGWSVLQSGGVDAWAGLDPIMAAAQEEGAELVYRNLDFNTYGALNATESFLGDHPEIAQVVLDTYAKARQWAIAHQEETSAILAEAAGLSESVAATVITERSNLDVSPVPGEELTAVLERVGPILVRSGDVAAQDDVDEGLATLLEPRFAGQADPATVQDA